MKLRYYSAIMTGIVTTTFSVGWMWNYTSMEIQKIAFWGTMAYWIGCYATLFVTERRDKDDELKNRRRHSRISEKHSEGYSRDYR